MKNCNIVALLVCTVLATGCMDKTYQVDYSQLNKETMKKYTITEKGPLAGLGCVIGVASFSKEFQQAWDVSQQAGTKLDVMSIGRITEGANFTVVDGKVKFTDYPTYSHGTHKAKVLRDGVVSIADFEGVKVVRIESEDVVCHYPIKS